MTDTSTDAARPAPISDDVITIPVGELSDVMRRLGQRLVSVVVELDDAGDWQTTLMVRYEDEPPLDGYSDRTTPT